MLVVDGGVRMPAPGEGQVPQSAPACDAVSPEPGSDGLGAVDLVAIFDYLVGAWEGEGLLFGRPATFVMSWAMELEGRFLGLSYEIRGGVSMSARAHYRIAEGETLQGVWVDSRGEILELEATATESRLSTVWRSDTETGRTVYQRTGDDSLEVCDYVQDGDGWRLFGTAQYSRR
jgi:hypothetical protein